HDTVERRTAPREPVLCLGGLGCDRRKTNARRIHERAGCERLQARTPLRQGWFEQRFLPVVHKIEDHEPGRRLGGEPTNPACSRMDALEQRVEGEVAVRGYRKLTVEYKASGWHRGDGRDDFGEVALERLPGFRLQRDVVAVAEGEAAKAVPLRLVLPIRPERDPLDRLRLHRR